MTTGTVSVIWRADQLSTLTYRQLCHALIPTTNNFRLADGEFEGLVAVTRRIEFGTIIQGAGIVDSHNLSILRVGATYKLYICVFTAGLQLYIHTNNQSEKITHTDKKK